MGDFILHKRNPATAKNFGKALAMMERQGSKEPVSMEFNDYVVMYYPKIVSPVVNFVEDEFGNFCGSSGTMFAYQGEFGESGLRRVLHDFDIGNSALNNLSGVFTLIIKKNGRLFLITDPLGCHRVFKSYNSDFISSSFLATCEFSEKLSINKQGVYEYAFQEATYGQDTVFEEVHLHDSLYNLEFCDDKIVQHKKDLSFDRYPTTLESYEELLEESTSLLRGLMANYVSAFGDRVMTALSGGYDSRLLLALLLEQKCTPKLYVYGGNSSQDVKIAREIAEGENLEISHIDKSALEDKSKDTFQEVIRKNFLYFDGFPIEGIFDFGANLHTRLERSKSDYLLLNGGGGEIYRNFFYLAKKKLFFRNFSAMDLIKVFYSSLRVDYCHPDFSVKQYRENLLAKLKYALGLSGNEITRNQIELAYPAFRLRYWVSKDSNVNTRLGSFATPYISYPLVRAALKIPMKYKNHGDFQADMIGMISPGLARYRTNYGYNFGEKAALKRRILNTISINRPVFVRQHSYAYKQRFANLENTELLSTEYLESVLDLDFPYMRRFFRLENIRDAALLARIYTLGYLFQFFSKKIAD